VAVTLELLHLWGAPQAWTFDGEDEQVLERMLTGLDEFTAEARPKVAVLFVERAGKIVASWTCDGLRRLASMIVSSPSSPQWLEMRTALEAAATHVAE
jgi:hypothetical protein